MKLTKEDIKKIEANKAGLEKRIKQGFKFPKRTDPNKTKQSPFVQFSLLEKEIGSDAMDDTEKAAYLSYACCSHQDGVYTSHFWTYSAKTPAGIEKEKKHFEACKLKLERFDFNQAYETAKRIVMRKKESDQKRGKESAISRIKKTEELQEKYCNFRKTQEAQGFKARTINNLFYENNPDCRNPPGTLTKWWNKHKTQA